MQFDAPEADVAHDDGFRGLVDQIGARTDFQGRFYKEKCRDC